MPMELLTSNPYEITADARSDFCLMQFDLTFHSNSHTLFSEDRCTRFHIFEFSLPIRFRQFAKGDRR